MSAPGKVAEVKPSGMTQDQAAKLIMLTDRHLRNLIREGWIPKDLNLIGVVQGYIRYRDDLDKRRQQNTAQAEAQQLKNEQARLQLKVAEGEYVQIGLAMTAFSDVIGSLRADLEAIPSRYAGRDPEARKKLEDLIARALNASADKCSEASASLSPVGGNSKKAAGELARRLGARKSKIPFKRGRPRSTRSIADPLRHPT